MNFLSNVRKLLSANIHSLFHSKRFWLCGIFMAALAIYSILNIFGYRSRNFDVSLESTCLQYIPLLFCLIPAMCALFINTDYNDGTIRNKLTVGCGRGALYFANLISSYLQALFYSAVYMIVLLPVGSFIVRIEDPGRLFSMLGMCLLAMLSLTALAVHTAMLISHRWALVLCTFLGIGLMLMGVMTNDLLEAPKMIDDYDSVVMTSRESMEDGTYIMEYLDKDGNKINPEDIPKVENPHYIEEPTRSIMRTFNEIQPGGQIYDILGNGHTERDENDERITVQVPYWKLAAYSLAVTA